MGFGIRHHGQALRVWGLGFRFQGFGLRIVLRGLVGDLDGVLENGLGDRLLVRKRRRLRREEAPEVRVRPLLLGC